MENCFQKIGVTGKIFGRNIGAKIFLVEKLVRKVGVRGQILSQKIGVKIFQLFFSLKIGFKYLISVGKFFVEKLVS